MGIWNFVLSKVTLTPILLLYIHILTNRESKQNRNGILCTLIWVKHYKEALAFRPFRWGSLQENAFLVTMQGTSQAAGDLVLLDILTCRFASVFWSINYMLEVKACACVRMPALCKNVNLCVCMFHKSLKCMFHSFSSTCKINNYS